MEGTDVIMVEEGEREEEKEEGETSGEGGEEVKEEPQQEEEGEGIIEESQTKTEEEIATGKGEAEKDPHPQEGEEELKTDGGEPEAKEDEYATAQPDETEQNQERSSSQHTPESSPLSTKHTLSSPIHTDTSHHTPCHSNQNVPSPPDFDAEWHLYSHVWYCELAGWNEDGVGKSDERGKKERKKVVDNLMIDSLLSFIRKEMKTRTLKLLIVVFFPPLSSTGLDETKQAPNVFEMSVVGFDEFSIEQLFATAGEKSMLLNSHLKTTRMSVGEEVEEEGLEEKGELQASENRLRIFLQMKRGEDTMERFDRRSMDWRKEGREGEGGSTCVTAQTYRASEGSSELGARRSQSIPTETEGSNRKGKARDSESEERARGEPDAEMEEEEKERKRQEIERKQLSYLPLCTEWQCDSPTAATVSPALTDSPCC
ncbi:hypothetical protein BLNAU_25198 [Blattamonas nauphoetae]|uniref:Uncharacterized protein n=1 Tax=Blattamonas nauphoetae TaxID=2049346 RepID=A0ABQ9WKA0_9EUKA|nr:hypothetical protein BLNAU_25198 [Blattamonas nauphoetae]